MTANLADELLEILHHVAPDVDPANVDRGRPMAEQLDLDSIDYQNFLAAVAARYAIDIPEHDVARLRTIDDLAGYLQAQQRSESRSTDHYFGGRDSRSRNR
jgi:acyl carrier protein